jgi:hypothetical protein
MVKKNFIFFVSTILAGLTGIFFSSFILESKLETKAASVVVEELGNIYLLHETFVERKSTVGKESFRSSDFNYGPIEYFDVTNPLKPFLHFREAGKIILFDNTLSQQGEPVDLFNLNLGQIELIAGSRGDAYWLWDAMNSEMIRTDGNFQKLTSTGNLSVLLEKELYPRQILERGDYVYLVDPIEGVFVFDIYGTYRTLLKVFPECGLNAVNNQLIYLEKGKIQVLGTDWITAGIVELPAEGVISFAYFNRKFYVLRNGFLEVWKE